MTTVGAYIDLGAWEKVIPGLYESSTSWLTGELHQRTPDGLDVDWYEGSTPPDGAQVYVYWEPTVIAVWKKEEESAEGTNGTEAGIAGEDDAEESDQSA